MRPATRTRVRKGTTLLAALYALNYFVTPEVIGVTRLEELARPRGRLDFNASRWQELRQAPGQRYEMVDSLLSAKVLIGVDTTQVRSMTTILPFSDN